ncbi:hypothetical protein ACFXPJ_12475, partial [Streptomyces goshikiensis]
GLGFFFTSAGRRGAAVGLNPAPERAEKTGAEGVADAVLLGRELLRDPYWARRAAAELGGEVRQPSPYHRSW